MNYEEMSDFEINVAVAKATGLDVQYQSMRNDGRVLVVVKVDRCVERYYRIPDYCNDWADAGLVMVENKIGITFVNGEWRASSVAAGYHEFSNINALRAVCCCFLLMNKTIQVGLLE